MNTEQTPPKKSKKKLVIAAIIAAAAAAYGTMAYKNGDADPTTWEGIGSGYKNTK